MNSQRPKILIEAYECSPARDHAPGAAWQIISRLAEWFDLWILCEQTQYAQEILMHLEEHPALAQSLHFHFIPRRKKEGFGRMRPSLPIQESLEYGKWLQEAFLAARHLHRQNSFDLVHHLRSNTFRQPGHLWKLGIPFVWGPVGGTYCVPGGLLSGLPLLSRGGYHIRNLINTLQLRYGRQVREAVRSAAYILTQTRGDQKNLQHIYRRCSMLLHEQATETGRGFVHSYDGSRPLEIAWIGRCLEGKALPILLEAIRQMKPNPPIRLHIVGDGPALNRWKKTARRLGVDRYCLWYGWVRSEQARKILQDCDLLAFTSIMEGTPATVMHALAGGVPVLCLRHCGMEDLITDSCGFPIPIDEPARIVPRMAAAMEDIMKHPEQILLKSRGAMETAAQHTWQHAAEVIRDVYYHCLGIGPDPESRPVEQVACYEYSGAGERSC